MSRFSLILKILGGIIALIGVVTYLSYQRDIRAARERVLSGSQVIETECGPIEYATIGEGPPVLVVHGAGGGFDQGIGLARDWIGDGFRIIAPSRFGYLRTPLPADASAAAQADAHASLLDALNIPSVAVMGISAGAPSSMQFALHYPDRISALVLVVPTAYVPLSQASSRKVAPKGFITDVILQSDFAIWAFMKVAKPSMLSFLGVSPEVQARYTSENIPGAKFIGPKSGGHLLVGREEKVRSEVTAFLKQHWVSGVQEARS